MWWPSGPWWSCRSGKKSLDSGYIWRERGPDLLMGHTWHVRGSQESRMTPILWPTLEGWSCRLLRWGSDSGKVFWGRWTGRISIFSVFRRSILIIAMERTQSVLESEFSGRVLGRQIFCLQRTNGIGAKILSGIPYRLTGSRRSPRVEFWGILIFGDMEVSTSEPVKRWIRKAISEANWKYPDKKNGNCIKGCRQIGAWEMRIDCWI